MVGQAPTYLRERARHEHARLALETVLAGCRRSGIDVLPVKGILTARLLYEDSGQRPIQDIDLRVRPNDIGRVEEIGHREGWQLLSRSWAYRTLAFNVRGFMVEFECHVGPPGLCGLRVHDMLGRARSSIAPLGMPHLQPELHDHAILLCVNAFKDKLIDAVPGAVHDLEILPTRPEFVPERFVALAVDAGVATIAWVVAHWLVEVRRSVVWLRLREALALVAPRLRYGRLFYRAVRSRFHSRQVLRVLARAGSDRLGSRVVAMGIMALEPIARAIDPGRRANVSTRRRTEEGVRAPWDHRMCS